VHLAVAVFVLAAICGDALNFAIGRHAAQWLLRRTRWLRPDHVELTRAYFARFGALTIVVARFIPIVRTIAPFLAGAGSMHYVRFALFNVAGGILWVTTLVYAGALLGGQQFVREHLTSATLGIVAVSLLPLALAAVRARLARDQATSRT
jgi:membrane-associated protein